MRRFWIFVITTHCCFFLQGQSLSDTIDTKYLEDQWYFSMSYNILGDKPSQIAQHGFSGGITTGIIKDIPFNLNRNVGIGIGFGYAYDVYVQNLKMTRSNGPTKFEIAPSDATNKFKLHKLEFPFEFRWRNSRPDRYRFWRIYPGFKLGYLVANKAKFKGDGTSAKIKKIEEFNKWQYGLTLSTGYSTWNLSIYYGLTSMFNDVYLEESSVDLSEFKIGLIIYII